MGRYVARVIQEDLEGRRRARDAGFQSKDLGSMVTIDKSWAVVEIGPPRLSGRVSRLGGMAGAAHYSTDRLPEPHLSAGLVVLRTRVLPPRLAAHNAFLGIGPEYGYVREVPVRHAIASRFTVRVIGRRIAGSSDRKGLRPVRRE